MSRQLRALYRNAIGLYGNDALARSPLAALVNYPQTSYQLSTHYAAHMKNYVAGGIYRFNITPMEYIEMERGIRERLLKLSEEHAQGIVASLPPLG